MSLTHQHHTHEEFVTSDNPVVAHNQYCEGIDCQGVLGWNCAGIQILCPVSPRHLVLLYDTKVYAVGAKHDRGASRIDDVADIRNLNAFQIATARENIYFRNVAMDELLRAQIERLDSRRRRKRHITVHTGPIANGDGTSELIHQFERMLPLKILHRQRQDQKKHAADFCGSTGGHGPRAGTISRQPALWRTRLHFAVRQKAIFFGLAYRSSGISTYRTFGGEHSLLLARNGGRLTFRFGFQLFADSRRLTAPRR
jgi:Protein of unknown function (DUF4238)